MDGSKKYNFFKGRKKGDPNFGDLENADHDPADIEMFEKMKMEVKAQGAVISLEN